MKRFITLSILLIAMTACSDSSKEHVVTENRAPAKTSLSPRARGKKLFQQFSCGSCHDTKGDRYMRGPSLVGIAERRDDEEVYAWINDPKSMNPKTAMPELPAGTSEADKRSIVSYVMGLKSRVQKRSTMAIDHEDPLAIAVGKKRYRQLCTQCHAKGATVSHPGPDLSKVADRMKVDVLRGWVKNPKSMKADSTMPAWAGNPQDLERVIAYLLTLRSE